MGVGPALLRLAALVVPALRHGPGPSVRHEVIIDVVHPRGDRVRLEIALANMACSASGSVASAIDASRGRRVRTSGSTASLASPASGPAASAVRCLNCSIVAAPSSNPMLLADRQQRHVRVPPPMPVPGRGGQDVPAPPARRRRAAASRRRTGKSTRPSMIRASAASSPAARAGLAQRTRRLRLRLCRRPRRLGNSGSACGGPASPRAAASGRRGPRRRITVVFATPSRRPISASDTPCPRQAAACSSRSRPACPADPAAAPGPAPPTPPAAPPRAASPRSSPSARTRRYPPTQETQLAQYADRPVPHHRIGRVVVEQHPAAHRDHTAAPTRVQAQISRLGHARRDRRLHATVLQRS